MITFTTSRLVATTSVWLSGVSKGEERVEPTFFLSETFLEGASCSLCLYSFKTFMHYRDYTLCGAANGSSPYDGDQAGPVCPRVPCNLVMEYT